MINRYMLERTLYQLAYLRFIASTQLKKHVQNLVPNQIMDRLANILLMFTRKYYLN